MNMEVTAAVPAAAAARRKDAVEWVESVVGPLGLSSEPTESELICCLRNGIVLCNLINKVQPGIVSKVVGNHESTSWDSRPLPAYQYFENIRNFLVAVENLNLPAFEASDLQRENFQAGSAARIVDCILALKYYHEQKDQPSRGNGVYKHATVKSPPFMPSALENFTRSTNTRALRPCTKSDAPSISDKQTLTESLVKTLSGNIVDSKENLNGNFLTSLQKGNQDPLHLFSEMLLGCLEEKYKNRYSSLNLQETSGKAGESHPQSVSILENSSCRSNSEASKRNSDYRQILHNQIMGLKDIRALWSETKSEFEDLRKQLMNDLKDLGTLVEEMSNRARGYQKAVQENRKLYNMVQDLKGNVRVCCRIRPMLDSKAKNVVNFQGEGTLLVLDPITLRAEGRQEYQFTHVYGPMATQDELFKDARPLIQSAMDGYDVCILAYGQPKSGKSYTMYGPSGGSENEKGINFFALNDLFQTVDDRRHTITYELHVQMVEIFNEQVRDLLAEDSAQSSLSNVTSHSVKTKDEAINLVKQGAMTLSNSLHSVLTIHVQGKDLSGKIFRSRLHLVDLGGSGGDDKSLSCLEDVIASLSRKKSYIHYKDSKLTSILEDALGGKAKILVFAHVIPEDDGLTETVRTLKFAQRISAVDLGAAQSNKTSNEVMELRNEIESLKSALGDQIPSTQQTYDKPRVISQRNPVKSRRLSLENQGKGTRAPPPTSLRVRRLSLECPKSNTLADYCTPEITNGKGSQIKKSMQAIGKLVSGSEKRNQHKQESESTKFKDIANRATSSKSRRHSLTSVPPSGIPRRSSLGGVSTDSPKRWA